ncbi:hypothetical protein EDB83DRAFT_2553227 [Lactarius deliciosus]|nr:hypothetical protein EDB83DRAFT_2553227 [Lactarius deliciosus]
MRSVIASKAQVAAALSSYPPPHRTPLHSPACRLPPRVTPLSRSSNSGLGFEEKEKEKAHLRRRRHGAPAERRRAGRGNHGRRGGAALSVAWGRGSVSDGRYTSARRCARVGWTLRKEAADAILMDDNVLPIVEEGTASSGTVYFPLVVFLLRLASEREDPDKMAVHGDALPTTLDPISFIWRQGAPHSASCSALHTHVTLAARSLVLASEVPTPQLQAQRCGSYGMLSLDFPVPSPNSDRAAGGDRSGPWPIRI